MEDENALVEPNEDASSQTSEASDVDEERVIWDNKAQYILSLIGFAVGVGNVWRFPYLCQKYGGGAFLIPYTVMLFVEGLPIFYLELSLGHAFHSGTVHTWRQLSPASIGIGIAMGCTSVVTNSYYVIVMAWSFFYLFNSFHDPLPWMTCDGVTGTTLLNGTEVNISDICDNGRTKFYWYNSAVQASSDIEHPGKMIWELALCLILSWVTVFLCMFKGIKSSGKAVYVTAIFPYVVLVILFFRGVTLKGAGTGIAFLFTPDFSILWDPVVWLEAAAQIFFSLSVGFGALITYTSYLDPRKKATPLKDSLVVSIINCVTSLFASIVIFSVLGFKAEYNDTTLKDVASGPGLSFIAFSEALGHMPGGPFWSVLFFLMLITLALDSMFGSVEVPLTDILDELGPRFRFLTKMRVLLVLCVGEMILGLIFVIQSGYYTFQLFNTYTVSLPLLTIALFECLVVSWLYGIERFSQDLEAVTGTRLRILWRYMWKYVSPLVIAVILVGSVIKQGIDPINYNIYQNYIESDNGKYPTWALVCAALLIVISVGPIPLVAFRYYVCRWRMKNEYSPNRSGISMENVVGSSPSYRSIENIGSDSETH